jgi:hypothetical protein
MSALAAFLNSAFASLLPANVTPTGANGGTAPAQADIDARVMSITDFGAVGDTFVSNTLGAFGASGAITNGQNLFTSTQAKFFTASIGKTISIAGAGAAGAVLNTTIAGYTSPTQVTLTVNASTTVTAAAFSFGTDDTAAVNRAIAWASGSSPLSRKLIAPPGLVFGVTSTIVIDTSFVEIEGAQTGSAPYDTAIGPAPFTSALAWLGAGGGTIMQIAPASGASNPALTGIHLSGLGFACNNLAAVGLDVSGVQMCTFSDLYASEGTTASFYIHGGGYTLGGYAGVQHCLFENISALQYTAAGNPILEESNSGGTANPSHNTWVNVSIFHHSAHAWKAAGVDNENIDNVYTYLDGSGVNSLYFTSFGGYASNTVNVSKLSANAAAYCDTSTYGIHLFLDQGNSTPAPTGPGSFSFKQSSTVETPPQTWSPTLTSTTGTLGSYTVNSAWYKIQDNIVTAFFDVSITSAGSSPGGAIISTLPVNSAASTAYIGTCSGYETNNTGDIIGGVVAGNSNLARFSFYAGVFPGANGNRLMVSLSYNAS